MMKKLTRLAAVTALFCNAIGSAQAAHFVELQGADMNFFVDADYFDLSNTSVTGNAITFGLDSDHYSVIATDTRAASSVADSLGSNAGKALYVVAHDGYRIQARFSSGAVGDYVMTGNNGGANGYVTSHIFEGANTGGVLSSSQWLTTSSNLRLNKSGVAGGGVTAYDLEPAYPSQTLSDVWAVSTNISLSVYQQGISTSAMSLSQLSYSFISIADGSPPVITPPVVFPPIPGVPEPGMYAMLLAGLGLLGFMQRRRK